MAGDSRSELASSSPEGSSFSSAYPNGQRGSYSGASLEKSGSFRESIDNRVLPSAAGATRSPAPVPPMEIPSPSQYLMLDPLSLGDPKNTRVGELRRVLGVSPEEHSIGAIQCKPTLAASEELKRFKASAIETTARARERTKVLQESLARLERYRNLISRKRQRNDIPSGERSGGASFSKMGSQIHQNPSDPGAQRLEDRAKNIVPNKRMRSSMGEVRSEGRATVPLRQGPAIEKDKNIFMDKEKNMLRACNGGLMPVEDKIRTLTAGSEGWEKKMKRKRSVSVGAVTRTIDGDREFKVAAQRLNNESRPRPSNGLSFRLGSSSGVSGTNKNDISSQSNGAGSRIIPRNEFDNLSLPNDRRERSVVPDKERGIAKGGNKLNIREDTQIGAQSPLMKGKASRGPRSASSSMMNSSSNFSRTSGGIDGWDQPPCSNKLQPVSGANNRKRPLPESSSPPMTQWGGHRPPKNTRTRRMTLVSPVSNHDDAQVLADASPPADVGARVMGTEACGPILSRGMSNTQQLKLKLENVLSPVGVSESEESGAAENKSKEKGLDSAEIEDGAVNAVQKVASFVPPSKKNKLSSREEIGDGVRRQGRSGRGSTQPKAGVSLSKEKSGNVDTAKPLRTGRPVSEISKVGRPPSKKMSDRKTFMRPSHAVNSGSSDLIGESDDDHDVLLLAAASARNASYEACASPFWKKMESVFSFVSEDKIAYLKRQSCLKMNFAEEMDGSLCNHVDDYRCEMTFDSGEKQVQPKPVGMRESMGLVCSFDDPQQVGAEPGKLESERWLEKIFPLSQRLLAAFIEVDETEVYDYENGHEDVFVHSESDYSPYGTAGHIISEAKEADRIESEYESELDFMTIPNCSRDNSCNGHSVSSNFRSPSTRIVSCNNELKQAINIWPQMTCSDYGQDHVKRIPARTSDVSGSLYECQYEHMCLDDKILTELQNIGLYPDTVPGLAEGEEEEIDKDLSELKMRLYEQMKRKKHHLCHLENAIQETKEANERKLEQTAMDKLVEMAYKKYLGGRGAHGSSNKSGVNKMSKQVALAFVKRVLVRCRKFEETGLSCFSETTFRGVLFSAPLPSCDGKSTDVLNGGASNAYGEIHNSHQESRLGASGVLTNITERYGPIGLKLETDSCQGPALSDQAFAKQEPIGNRGKKREVLLDDVVGGTSSRATAAALGNSLPGGAQGKGSERDRDQNTLTRNSVPKAGRPSLGSVRGERKPKAKPKQKTAQLTTSGNGLLGRFTEPIIAAPSVCESLRTDKNEVSKENDMPFPSGNASKSSKNIEETIDFTNLPLDSIEGLDVGDALGGQGQDIGSWLNVDDDALQDNDLIMGLEIPMDDLSELNMNF
uniref:Chlorophyllase-1, chloroplastic n=1 Tax=Anthurium amnicola TaxID=1678845 RepID=A0A1D1Z2K0_9ARAE